MRYVSTRGGIHVALEDAIMAGTAPDGGLYIPEQLPEIAIGELPSDLPLDRFAARVLRPFFAGSSLESDLDEICREAFNFPAPVKTISTGPEALGVLELFHGPTAAFKDFGARFLAACMARIIQQRHSHATVLVATSTEAPDELDALLGHLGPGW